MKTITQSDPPNMKNNKKKTVEKRAASEIRT